MRNSTRLALLPLLFILTAAAPAELQQWKKQADRVTITRDDWGIAHVRGKTDADAVFGMIYAQAEDDFPRIEANYLTSLGRTAEADGEKAIWQDLRARLYVSEDGLKANYAASPDWLKKLMNGWAAGLNYYLATHPNVRPRVLTRFEPWMALSFTEGSIGGDIERIDLGDLQKFYAGKRTLAATVKDFEPRGSNGIAIAPSITANGGSLLLINPHTSFFFRSELQMSSDEGLNAYGASTWGQFFIYQGFNERTGWMHTSSGVDNVDEFAEKVERKGKGFCYRYGKDCRPLIERPVTISYRTPDGKLAMRTFSTWRTHHGPIVREANGRWISFAMMDKPVAALQQSFLRTKTRDLQGFPQGRRPQGQQLQQYGLRRQQRRDCDADAAVHAAPEQSLRLYEAGRRQRSGDGLGPAPRSRGASEHDQPAQRLGPEHQQLALFGRWRKQPKASQLSALSGHVRREPAWHSCRSAARSAQGLDLDRLQNAAFDSYQPGFASLLPGLIESYDALPPKSPQRAQLSGPIGLLRTWDYRWSAGSVANTIANFWGDEIWKLSTSPDWDDGLPVYARLQRVTGKQKLDALTAALARIKRDFGWWQVPWGEVNRFQRISPAIDHPFTDAGPSIPVPFSSARWGSLAVVRRVAEAGHEALVRDERQQLRRGRRIRAASSCPRGHGGRGKRQSRLQAF